MKSPILLWVAVLVLLARVGFGAGEAEKGTYANAAYGFSMNPPEFGKGSGVVMPVTFSAPGKGGFAANINVIVQPTKTTRKEYLDLSLAGFKRAGATVNSQKELEISGRDAEIIEYEMKSAGRELRFLAMFVVGPDSVYLITCTSTKEEYGANEEAFKKALESFRLSGEK